MTYYLLPKSSYLFHKYIDCITSNEEPKPVISNTLSNYLYEIKEDYINEDYIRNDETYKKIIMTTILNLSKNKNIQKTKFN